MTKKEDARVDTRTDAGLPVTTAADVAPASTAGAPEWLTFATFSAVNRERCESPDGFGHDLHSWSTSDWFTAVLGELGEAANIAKKLNRHRDGIRGNTEGYNALRDKLRKELGDTFVYLDLLAQRLGISIGAAAVEVFNAKSDALGCAIRIGSPAAREAQVRGSDALVNDGGNQIDQPSGRA
jgi:NTP pyrophosphatase (non-canonical NTP hydrolase)